MRKSALFDVTALRQVMMMSALVSLSQVAFPVTIVGDLNIPGVEWENLHARDNISSLFVDLVLCFLSFAFSCIRERCR